MTIREFCRLFGDGDPEKWWRENWLLDGDEPGIDMDGQMDQFAVWDWWLLKYSSNAKAYHYLWSVDLGPQLGGAKAVGSLNFLCGGAPGVDYLGVHALDEITLSLFQQRLNELGTGLAVRMH